ncbi:uroporphyrinogen-III C-methyltransferase [Janibacter sp. GXQ6167]|uniref:uroporphyrinogen-III C-methyltransferase n=1 Tax=Janibacter sp. GXQ6167 TaxID=3240791 RepID=UPI0035265084
MSDVGRVWIVGGGPGAGDLITVRAARALAGADVVVTDRLGPSALLSDLGPHVEIVDVGKAPGHHRASQEEINDLLVERARRGLSVVRLKGGDPFIFGRGGEEVRACRAAGVPVEVVPGVSSALAVPALADVPLTHRGLVSGALIVHGHDRLPSSACAVAASGDCTIVILMGVMFLARHAADLVESGADPATPVAVVERGSTSRQRIVRSDLANIAQVAGDANVRSPAVIVIGAVAAGEFLGPLDAVVHTSIA